jgi:hypothetical protein
MELLRDWANFYVIVGSSAGALIGLQFVVITLIGETTITQGMQAAGEAFSTPTIVHFGIVLFLAGTLSAPWPSMLGPEIAAATTAVAGTIYTFIVLRRMRRQPAYAPETEDWLFHFALPLIAYAAMATSSLLEPAHARGALFGIAASVLLLLFIGIHNAWDSVEYIVFVHKRKHQEKERQESTRT